MQGIGRADRATGALDAGAGSTNPRLYEVKIPLSLSNYGKTISSITITRTGGSSTTSVLNIMGISVDHQPCLPTPTVTAGSITTVGATLSWTAVSGSQGYEYVVSSSATPPASGTPHGINSIALGGLNPGTTYYFHVRNKCGTTSYSVWNTTSFSTLACPAAGTPTITNNAPGTVSFSWPGTSTPGVVNYQWAVTPTAALPGSWNTTNATSATYNALVPGSTYYIHVRSNCGTSTSTYTALQFTNQFPPCAQPATLSISGVNMHGADMRWTSSPDVMNGYQYALTTTANPPSSGIMLTTDTFYSPGNLIGGQKYYFWLRTHCGTSLNNISNVSTWMVDSFTTPLTCLPASGANITNVTATTADISWAKYPGIYGYEYILNTSATPPATGISGTAITFNNLAPTNLFSGTGYYFHLRIRCDTFNYSPWITKGFNTTNVCNAAPSSVALTAIAPTQATFSWTGVPGAQQYQYCATTTNIPDINSNTFSSQTTATVLSLSPSTSYYFHVRAYCSPEDLSGWETIPFSTVSVSVDPLASEEANELRVYPNPAQDLLQIELKGTVKGKPNVMLMDLKGQVLRQVELSDSLTEINIQDLPQGMYLIRYHDAENTKTLRINKL